MSQARAAYFKPEGASLTLYPARVNANLAGLSDGPLKDKMSFSIGEPDMEVTKSLSRESTALHSHLLWLTNLLLVLSKRLEQPSAVPVIQPIIVKVLQHQKWVLKALTKHCVNKTCLDDESGLFIEASMAATKSPTSVSFVWTLSMSAMDSIKIFLLCVTLFGGIILR